EARGWHRDQYRPGFHPIHDLGTDLKHEVAPLGARPERREQHVAHLPTPRTKRTGLVTVPAQAKARIGEAGRTAGNPDQRGPARLRRVRRDLRLAHTGLARTSRATMSPSASFALLSKASAD